MGIKMDVAYSETLHKIVRGIYMDWLLGIIVTTSGAATLGLVEEVGKKYDIKNGLRFWGRTFFISLIIAVFYYS